MPLLLALFLLSVGSAAAFFLLTWVLDWLSGR